VDGIALISVYEDREVEETGFLESLLVVCVCVFVCVGELLTPQSKE